jgi:hypothetical protein
VPVGSTIDTFISDFCHLKPTNEIKLTITRNNIERNYMEYWNAMPIGSIESFETSLRKLQNGLPENFTLQVKIAPGQVASVTVLDDNGNPQPPQQSALKCIKDANAGFNYFASIFDCLNSMTWF